MVKSNTTNCFHCDPFFTQTSDCSWQQVHRVDSDDAAIVIASALIQPNCAHKHLNIAAMHFNATIGEVGYKALAYAIAIKYITSEYYYASGRMLLREVCV